MKDQNPIIAAFDAAVIALENAGFEIDPESRESTGEVWLYNATVGASVILRRPDAVS